MEYTSLTIEGLKVGQLVKKKFYLNEILGKEFADVSLDYNPIHLDAEYASSTNFGEKIAHGMLIGSYISGVIGTELPGVGTIYAKQELSFKKPVYYNQEILIAITVQQIQIEKNRVELRTQCFDAQDNLLVDGIALVLPRKKDKGE